MKLLAVLLFATACSHSASRPTTEVGNTQAAQPAPIAPDPTAPADDCEPASTDDSTTYGVHIIEVSGGAGHPFRWADKGGNVIATPFLFDNGADYWQEGVTRIVGADGKMGFLDEHGAITVKPTYDWVYPYCHGIARTALGGQAGYIDLRGTPTQGPTNDSRPLIPERHVD